MPEIATSLATFDLLVSTDDGEHQLWCKDPSGLMEKIQINKCSSIEAAVIFALQSMDTANINADVIIMTAEKLYRLSTEEQKMYEAMHERDVIAETIRHFESLVSIC